MLKIAKSIIRSLTLATPQYRLMWWLVISAVIFLVPFRWLENLSIHKAIGFENAPSIGLTRAYWLILHGRFSEALDFNWLIVPVLAAGLPILAYDAVKLYRQRNSEHTSK